MTTPKSLQGRVVKPFSTQGGGMNRDNPGKYPRGDGRPPAATRPRGKARRPLAEAPY